jgi:hypothetical protein
VLRLAAVAATVRCGAQWAEPLALPHAPDPCSKAHIEGEALLDFCKDSVGSVPDLPPADAPEPVASPRAKRTK